jgi:acyl-[acyl-carrier-protein] desaturase
MSEAQIDDARLKPQIELLHSLQGIVAENLALLLPIDQAWQPTDYLPDLAGPDWQENLARFRAPAQQISDELLVVLVGDMVTEEALPNYAMALNLIVRDPTGTGPEPWARWMRGWIAEENRHGDLLNAYLRLTGRVDMRSVEVTVHHLIADGFNPKTSPDLYSGLIYTSFQERATKISHARVGAAAAKQGEQALASICRKIAGDESRHEAFYTTMMRHVMKHDPDRALPIFKNLIRRIIAMPGRMMTDGKDPDLFEHFAAVAQRIGVYTAHDYAAILKHLVSTWEIGALKVRGEAAAAQEYLCAQALRLESIADSITEKAMRLPPRKFSWIHDRMA